MLWAKNAFPRPKVSLAAIREQASRVNWVGQVIFSIGIVLMFSSSWIKIPGLDQFTNLMVFLIGDGIVTTVSFLQDDFAPSPWIDPQVLRNVTFLMSTSVLFLAMFVNSFSNISLPFYLQDYLPFSPGQSGLIVAVQSVVMLMLSPFVGRLAANPARRPNLVTIGLIMLLVSQIGYAFYGGQVWLRYILWPIIVNGIGMVFTLTPNNSITMGLVSPKLAGVAGSMHSLFRTIGMAVANKSKVDSLDDLKGKTVAAKTGSSGAMYAQRMAKKYDFKITYFNDSNTMYNDVIIGNTVAAFEDQPVMAYAIQQGTKMKIVTDPADGNWYGFGVKKGDNAELLKKFNAGYAKIVKDETYDKIVNRYLGEGGYNYKENAAAKSAADQSIWSLIQENKGALLDGLIKTLQLTVVGIVLAAIWGVLLGVMGVAPGKLVRGISSTIIYIFRGLPMLVLAFFIYIGNPNLTGQKIPAFTAGVITLILNEGAYIGAFVRGGFKPVDPGQLEAARSLGKPYGKAMRKVVMPQVIRLTIPSFINQFIITLKDTSILSAIGIIELTQTGTLIIARNLQGFMVWLMIAVLYLIVITLLTWLSNWVEKRIN